MTEFIPPWGFREDFGDLQPRVAERPNKSPTWERRRLADAMQVQRAGKMRVVFASY
jgi:hypothetical protein